MRELRARREELLGKIVDVLLSQGISNLSLRPLAKEVGTSARLLIYHFESKEKLLTDALEVVRQRIEVSLRGLAVEEDPHSLEEFLLMFWNWATRKPNQRYFRLLFEVDGIAMQNRAGFPAQFWGAGFARWRQVLKMEFSQLSGQQDRASAVSTFVVASLTGLLHDFLKTGDRQRTTDALQCLIESLSDRPLVRKKRKTARG